MNPFRTNPSLPQGQCILSVRFRHLVADRDLGLTLVDPAIDETITVFAHPRLSVTDCAEMEDVVCRYHGYAEARLVSMDTAGGYRTSPTSRSVRPLRLGATERHSPPSRNQQIRDVDGAGEPEQRPSQKEPPTENGARVVRPEQDDDVSTACRSGERELRYLANGSAGG